MKKLLILSMALLFSASLMACGGGSAATKSDPAPTGDSKPASEATSKPKKSLKKFDGNRLEGIEDEEEGALDDEFPEDE